MRNCPGFEDYLMSNTRYYTPEGEGGIRKEVNSPFRKGGYYGIFKNRVIS
jgi:hypothetical protein